jgi:hypothetical protein
MAPYFPCRFPSPSCAPVFTFIIPDDTTAKDSAESSPISASDKENSPVPHVDDTPWTDAATEGTHTTTEDPDSPDTKQKLPEELSYEAFLDFCKIPDQRAQLWDKLKDGAAARLCVVLTLFHDTFRIEKRATGLQQRTHYTRASLVRLNDSLQGLQPLVFQPDVPIPTALLSGFAAQTKVIEHLVAHHSHDALKIAMRIDLQRRELFEVLTALKLSLHGNRTFSQLEYLALTHWDLVEHHQDSGWNGKWERDPLFKECKPSQIHACCPKWKKVLIEQLNTTFYDPQAD